MKKFIFIVVALAFMACEKTFFVGGTVTDLQTRDSIEGIEMGLFVYNQNITSFTDMKWSDLELIASATTNSDGFFSVELESGFDMSRTIFLPLPPTDTLSVNAQYTPKDSQGLLYPYYGTTGDFKLQRPSHVLFHLVNFTQEMVEVHCVGRSDGNPGLKYSTYLDLEGLITGQNYTFDFYEVDNSYNKTQYLGSSSQYIETQLPDDPNNVFWEVPMQRIEIDHNTLEK
jgi:hypothetical protein